MLHGHLTLLAAHNCALAYSPHWLYAQVVQLSNLRENPLLLLVYRSLLLRDTSPRFEPVRRFLSASHHRVEAQRTYKDEWMMFGEGEWTVYQVLNKTHYQPEDFIDIDPGIGETLRGRGVDIVHQLREGQLREAVLA